MIRAIAAGLGLAVAALFVLLVLCGVVSVPGVAAGLHPDCNVTMPCVVPAKPVLTSRQSRAEAARIARADRFRNVEFGSPMYPPETARSFLSSRPSSCPPRAWCGCWLAKHLGLSDRSLWLARRWASLGSDAGGPRVGAIVVWRHHVGIITGKTARGWVVKSGNDGNAVRERVRSVAGAVAFRWPS